MSLFVLASKDGWVSIMYTGLDAVAVDTQVGAYIIYLFILYTARKIDLLELVS